MANSTTPSLWTGLALLLLLNAARAAAAAPKLRLIFAPVPADNSPTLDLLAVAAKMSERGHDVYVLASDRDEKFIRMAAARHSSNTTAELGLRLVRFNSGPDSSISAMLEKFMKAGGPQAFRSRTPLGGARASAACCIAHHHPPCTQDTGYGAQIASPPFCPCHLRSYENVQDCVRPVWQGLRGCT